MCEHFVACQAVFFPFLDRVLVKRAYFPLRQRVLLAILQPFFLFRFADIEVVF